MVLRHSANSCVFSTISLKFSLALARWTLGVWSYLFFLGASPNWLSQCLSEQVCFLLAQKSRIVWVLISNLDFSSWCVLYLYRHGKSNRHVFPFWAPGYWFSHLWVIWRHGITRNVTFFKVWGFCRVSEFSWLSITYYCRWCTQQTFIRLYQIIMDFRICFRLF